MESMWPGSTSGKAQIPVLSRQTEQVFMALLFQLLVLCPDPLLQFAVNYHIHNPVDVCTGCLICLFLTVDSKDFCHKFLLPELLSGINPTYPE